jgi:hypothetical protein
VTRLTYYLFYAALVITCSVHILLLLVQYDQQCNLCTICVLYMQKKHYLKISTCVFCCIIILSYRIVSLYSIVSSQNEAFNNIAVITVLISHVICYYYYYYYLLAAKARSSCIYSMYNLALSLYNHLSCSVVTIVHNYRPMPLMFTA